VEDFLLRVCSGKIAQNSKKWEVIRYLYRFLAQRTFSYSQKDSDPDEALNEKE